MPEASFDLGLIQHLLENRTPAVTAVAKFFSFMGEIEGFVLVVCLIHVAFDKKLALRLAVLALVTMSFNHVLKTLIANPRPFVIEGTYAEKWAVSAAKAAELAPEFSTPSGHAMAASSFYSYLCASVKRRSVKIAALVTFVLIGLSRPYLGVHYLEDVLMGWALGISIALFAVKFGERVGAAWNSISLPRRGLAVVAASVAIWLTTSPLYESSAHGQPLPFVSYLGFLSALVVAYPLEARWVGFDPRSSGAVHKGVRLLMSVGLVMGALLLLDPVFASLASDASPLGNVLRYLRYAVAGTLGVLVAPFLFVRLGLAESLHCERTE